MALTPVDYSVITDDMQVTTVEQAAEPSRTWHLNLETGRIDKQIDGMDAIRQYIRKVFITPRNQYLIYNDEYGEEVSTLIGSNLTQSVQNVELPRLIEEALLYDDRISKISDIEVNPYTTDGVHITFTVELVDGELLEEEVTI